VSANLLVKGGVAVALLVVIAMAVTRCSGNGAVTTTAPPTVGGEPLAPETAAALESVRDRVIQRVNDDYRTYRLSLERALETENNREALVAVEKLSRLIEHRPNTQYSQWILLLEQRLAASVQDGNRSRRSSVSATERLKGLGMSD